MLANSVDKSDDEFKNMVGEIVTHLNSDEDAQKRLKQKEFVTVVQRINKILEKENSPVINVVDMPEF